MNMGLCTLWALTFSSQLEERLRNYSSLICTSPPFQGTISNWTIASKAVSWTDVGYSFVISTSIKQVKGLELILSVSFVFGSWCCEPTSCGQRISLYKWNRQLFSFKNKTNPSERECRNIRSGQINSLVHSEKNTECTGELSNIKRPGRPQRTTVVDDRRNGKEKPFHNIQPREEHSPGGRRFTVKVYNQEKASPEQIQRVHHKVQTRPD